MSIPATVILVAYHGDAWLPACVASLRGSLAGPVRLVLVDNAGNTCIESLDVTGFDAAVLRLPRPMGFAEANNSALTHIGLDTDAVCFLNQDTLSRPGWLDACLEVLEADRSVGAVTPLVEDYEGRAWDPAFLQCAKASPRLYECLRQGVGVPLDGLAAFVPVPEIPAAAMLVRTEALIKAGPFDPIYGSYYEDYDLCRRIGAAGYRVGICPRGRIGHFGGSVTTDRPAYRRRARSIARNRVIYAARWTWTHRTSGLARYLLAELPRNLARSALGRSQTPLRSFLLAQGDLARLGPRLASAAYDRQRWNDYLRAIGWPNTNGRTDRQALQTLGRTG